MVKYPWEKDEPEEEFEGEGSEEGESSEETAFPWLDNEGAEQQSSPTLNTPLSPEEEAVVQTMVVNARRKPWNGKAQPPVLSYVNTEPEPLDWKLPVGILAGAACLGALAFFLLNQQPESSISTTRSTTTTTETLPPATTSTIPENNGALIPTADLDAVREKTNKGRANPFKDTLPVPPPPPPPPVVKAAVAPPPAKPLPPPQPIFTGISVAVSGNDRVAIIQVSGLSPAPTIHEVTIGDQVAGWSVKSVTTERTVLVKGNKTLNVPFL
jgi:hypothetical protein